MVVEQVFYASMTDEASGVAFWAHIGGFLYGLFFAVVMKVYQVEEKYISPRIEKTVSMTQNPLFLQAQELSEKRSYPEALTLLKKVIQEEPNHLGAHQEIMHIYEFTNDMNSYAASVASILEILTRKKDWEFFQEFYKRVQEFPKDQRLPAKTLLGLSAFLEEHKEYATALNHYEDIVQNYPEDPTAMKAYLKLSRLYLDKLNERGKGIEAFWKSYHHKHSTDEWRDILEKETKKYEIPLDRKASNP